MEWRTSKNSNGRIVIEEYFGLGRIDWVSLVTGRGTLPSQLTVRTVSLTAKQVYTANISLGLV